MTSQAESVKFSTLSSEPMLKSDRGFVLWFTGLPGAGKTTITRIIEPKLIELGKRVQVLDGDEIRGWLSPMEGFSREDRERHLKRVAHIAELLSRNGVVVICSLVSPYRSSRDYARTLIPNFIEAYVKCDLETAVQRDPKGLYKKAREGAIKNMTGTQDPYEEPAAPEILVDTDTQSPEESAEFVLSELRRLGYVQL
jgi:adenylyl-sulfate kinase